MSDILILGATGAVGSAFCDYLDSNGLKYTTWDRQQTPLWDFQAVEKVLKKIGPSVVYNFAIASKSESFNGRKIKSFEINVELPVLLAKLSNILSFKLVQTSTVMVFGEHQPGPFDVKKRPDPDTNYGKEKLTMEKLIKSERSDSVVIRLGWQIGKRIGNNNMVDFIDKSCRTAPLSASKNWKPACSKLEDTTKALHLAANMKPGLYQFNDNRGKSFFNIARDLKKRLNMSHWNISESTIPNWNQTMINNIPRYADF